MSVLKRKVAQLESYDVSCNVKREGDKLVLTIESQSFTHVEKWDSTGERLLEVRNIPVRAKR